MENNGSIKCISRAVSVLESFTTSELELTATDICRKLRMPRTTVNRMLLSLTQNRLLERNKKTGKYTISPGLYRLGSLYLGSTDITKAAEPVIKTVNELTSEAVSVGIFDKGNMILLMKEESKHAFRLTTHIGTIMPAYATAIGKAFLSELSEAEIDGIIPEERLRPITKKTIATKTELKLELEQIRKTGIAINREGGYEGVESIAHIIRNADGKAVAAMSIPVPIFRMNEPNRKRLSTLLRMGSSLVSYRLGYQDMNNPVRDIEEIRSWWEQNKSD